MKKVVIFLTMCIMTVMLVKTTETLAASKVLSWNLVDSGKHLDWDGKTRYASHFKSAVNVWNKYKKGVIRKDNIFRVQDVVVSDYFEISNTAAVTASRGTIRFNSYVMESFNSRARKNVCIHELGHALGLAHNTSKDIMYKYATTRIKLSNNDKKSYDYAYKYLY